MSNYRGSGHRGAREGRGGVVAARGRRQFGNTRGPAKDVNAMQLDNQSVEGENQSPSRDTSHLSDVRFDSLAGKIDNSILASIPFTHMSLVQAATFDKILSGVDVLAQAKTGTGKTVAFLLPAIQSLLTNPPQSPSSVSVFVLSPTRELALQIKKEADMLLNKLPGNRLQVQCCIGGTNMNTERTRLQTSRCDILVATPGRMLDHIENSNMKQQLTKVRIVVLDEADRMLDMGFRNEIRKIMAVLSPRSVQPRQSLLFSATIPEGIRETADLNDNCVFINTLKPGEENTHKHVPQEYVVVPMADFFTATVSLLKQTFEKDPTSSKVILFFPTARQTGIFQSLLENLQSQASSEDPLKSVPAFEVHSRISQGKRMSASGQFGKAQRGILCSSDVTARGVDFPGVTQVIQVGLPQNSDQYIHRLGRTARAGASGSGILILDQAETFFLQSPAMQALSIQKMQSIPNMSQCQGQVSLALGQVPDREKAQAYQAALGYYKGFVKGLRWSTENLVSEMNNLAKRGMLYEGGHSDIPPPLLNKTVGKMGLKGVPGLHTVNELPSYLEEDNANSNKTREPSRPKRVFAGDSSNERQEERPRYKFMNNASGGEGLQTHNGLMRGSSRGGRGQGRGRGRGQGRGRGGGAGYSGRGRGDAF